MWLRHQKEPSGGFSKDTIIPLVFFLLLFAALFLGDGKQTAVDTVFAGGIISLWVIAFYQKQKIRPLPTTVRLLWAGVFVAHVISATFSDSIGYSITATMRMAEAYLVYRIFYNFSSKNTIKVYSLCVLGVITLAAVGSFVYIFVLGLANGLPSMNLLYASYGHNQLAGLLLFGIPLVIGEGAPIPSWCKKALLVLFLSGMIFSFARGAWVLLAAYLAFLLVTKRLVGKFNASVVIVFMGAVAGLLVATFLLAPRFAHDPPIMNNDWFYKQTIKPPIYESRIQYWHQALRAIQERPLFGSGPGTFYLQSKRLQSAPASYSWFAHSFPLETLVELGVLGALPMFFLLFYHGKEIVRGLRVGSNTLDIRHGAPLALGAGLTLVYSVYEYNMNYLVVWLLFWATLGVVSHQNNT